MTPQDAYAILCDRHKAYNWAPPIPYDDWVARWWPYYKKQIQAKQVAA